MSGADRRPPVRFPRDPAVSWAMPPPLALASHEGRAPGKVILVGEHAVVYGYRAIAASVDLFTTVSLHDRPGRSEVEDTDIWDARLGDALATIIPAEGVGVSISSELPTGCGMGSSAALAVAAVRAAARREGRTASFEECFERGMAIERVFHGNPSGLDHTVSALGCPVIFRRGERAVPLRLAAPIRLVVANTGTPGDTAAMVDLVKARKPEAELLRLGALTEMVAARLALGHPVGPFLHEAHWLLRRIGVSTRELDELCRAMEAAGAEGAKLAGAGGGGIVIAQVTPATEDAVRRAASRQVDDRVYTVSIGG